MFQHWIDAEGKRELRQMLQNTRYRWWFGNRRARRALYRRARQTFHPGGTFAGTTKKHLDRLPTVIRVSALAIHRAGHRSLSTYDAKTAISVVPRGLVRSEFKRLLTQELSGSPMVRDFGGLAERVVSMLALEAEATLFEFIARGRGRQLVDASGRGVILDVDRDFRWRLDSVDGHYYYACSLDTSVDLADNKERRRFTASIKELFQGQAVYLKRMRPEEIAETAEALRLRISLESKGHSLEATLKRARKTSEYEDTLLSIF